MKRVGGQALPAGIIMRRGDRAAVAIRTESGEIELTRGTAPIKAGKLGRVPLIRGLAELAAAVSASVLGLGSRRRMVATLVTAIVIIAGLWGLSELVALLLGLIDIASPLLGRLVYWLSSLAELMLFLYLLRLLPPIRRMFMYHGAEHKCISCYESGRELTPENVSARSRVHPRCGTNLMTTAILIFAFIEVLLPETLPGWTYYITEPAALFLALGLAFELRRAGKKAGLAGIISDRLGTFVQRHLTTIEPEPGMIECGIAALEACISDENEDLDLDVEIPGDK